MTLDRDFTQLVAVSGDRAPSVIYIRQNVDRASTTELILKVLAACEPALIGGSLLSVTDDEIRVRPLPVDRSSEGA